jgi:hypothetical protein
MEFVEHLLVLIHLLGLAAVIGSAVFVARGRVTRELIWGARIQVLSGLLLVGLKEMGDGGLNHTKIAVKLVIGLLVVGCTEIAGARERKRSGEVSTLATSAGVLAVINAAVATLWETDES